MNDRPTDFFQISKGLCQGCPLSPLLFIIMVETLSRKLEYERIAGNLLGLQIAHGVKNPNHLQFANDTLLLGGSYVVIASRFKQVMDSFLDTSGGVVNNRKCQIMDWNSRPHVMQSISRIFQFPLDDKWTSFCFLGIPISLKATSSQEWLHITEKINLKFIQWGTQWLNPVGRVILIKAILLTLSLYQCSALLAPRGIVNQISMKIRKFLWQGGKFNHKKFHLSIGNR